MFSFEKQGENRQGILGIREIITERKRSSRIFFAGEIDKPALKLSLSNLKNDRD